MFTGSVEQQRGLRPGPVKGILFALFAQIISLCAWLARSLSLSLFSSSFHSVSKLMFVVTYPAKKTEITNPMEWMYEEEKEDKELY